MIINVTNGGEVNVLCSRVNVNENPAVNSITLFPNPFTSQLNLESSHFMEDACLTVYNIFGQEVKKIKNITGYSVLMNRGNLPDGIYYILLDQHTKPVLVQKIIISN
jgi:hypothetical protein